MMSLAVCGVCKWDCITAEELYVHHRQFHRLSNLSNGLYARRSPQQVSPAQSYSTNSDNNSTALDHSYSWKDQELTACWVNNTLQYHPASFNNEHCSNDPNPTTSSNGIGPIKLSIQTNHCKICGRSFESPAGLIEHLASTHGINTTWPEWAEEIRKITSCSNCGIEYFTRNEVEKCLEKHNIKRCWICLDEVPEDELELHYHTEHLKSWLALVPKTYSKCRWCSKLFKGSGSLSNHCNTVHFSDLFTTSTVLQGDQDVDVPDLPQTQEQNLKRSMVGDGNSPVDSRPAKRSNTSKDGLVELENKELGGVGVTPSVFSGQTIQKEDKFKETVLHVENVFSLQKDPSNCSNAVDNNKKASTMVVSDNVVSTSCGSLAMTDSSVHDHDQGSSKESDFHAARRNLDGFLAKLRDQHAQEINTIKAEQLTILAEKKKNEERLVQLEDQHAHEISVIKTHLWCVVCKMEGKYNCCWKAVYCSSKCQHAHWQNGHDAVCRREVETRRNYQQLRVLEEQRRRLWK